MSPPAGRHALLASRSLRVAVGVLAALGLVLALRYVVRAPSHRLVIATGPEDGNFRRMAGLYVRRLAEQGVTLEIVRTHGSVENLARIEAPGSNVDVAFVSGGLTNARRSPSLTSLGTVAYDPIWVAYRAELGDLDSLVKLRGRRIGVGADGSGAQSIARSMLAAYAITSANATLVVDDGPESAIGALTSGRLDAALIMRSPEDPATHALFADGRLRVMNLADAEGLTRNLPFLHALRLPRGTIDLALQAPDRDLSVVASTVTLVARKDVHQALVYLLMSVIDEVHEPPGLLHRENEFPSDKDTDLPLSPQAETYYRSGKPFLQRYLPFGAASVVERLLKVGAPILLVVFPFLRALPAFYRWRVKRKLARLYRRLIEAEVAAAASPGAGSGSAEAYEASLRAIERDLRAERIPHMYSNELYILREHIELARRQRAQRA